MKLFMKLSLLSLATTALLAGNEATPSYIKMYAQEVYRVSYDSLSAENQEKLKKEFEAKMKLARLISQKLKDDPSYAVAMNFKTLDYWGRQIASKADVSEKTLKELFSKKELKIAPKYKIRNILVKNDSEADEIVNMVSKHEGEKRLQMFSSLASEKSLDLATNSKNGDGGWVDSSMLPPEVIKKIAETSKGGVVKLSPIKDVGIQIILVEDITPEHSATFEEAQLFLKNVAVQNAIQEEAKKLLEKSARSK